MTVVVGAAIVRDGKLLAGQRSYPSDLAGQWELPGGQVDPGEPEAAALVRECAEELGVRIRVGERLGTDVPLPNGKVLRVYAAGLADPAAEPAALEHKALRWLSADDLDGLDWLPADRALLPALRNWITGLHRAGR